MPLSDLGVQFRKMEKEASDLRSPIFSSFGSVILLLCCSGVSPSHPGALRDGHSEYAHRNQQGLAVFSFCPYNKASLSVLQEGKQLGSNPQNHQARNEQIRKSLYFCLMKSTMFTSPVKWFVRTPLRNCVSTIRKWAMNWCVTMLAAGNWVTSLRVYRSSISVIRPLLFN